MENFWKIAIFYLVWVPKVFCFVFFSYLSDRYQTLTQSTAWNDKKNAWSTNLLSLIEKKLLSLKFEFWPIFRLKIGQISPFKLINFLYSKDRRFVDRAFFCRSKLYFMLNFGNNRMSRKKMRNKKLLVLIFGCQKYFVSHFFPICPIATKLWHKVQLGITKKTRGQRTSYLW